MPRQFINFRLIGAIAILGGGLLNTATAVANPALGMSIAPNSSVSVGHLKPGATVAAPRVVKQPQIILHRPAGFNQKGTHANAMGGQVHRHRVSVPLTVRHDMVRSAF